MKYQVNQNKDLFLCDSCQQTNIVNTKSKLNVDFVYGLFI